MRDPNYVMKLQNDAQPPNLLADYIIFMSLLDVLVRAAYSAAN